MVRQVFACILLAGCVGPQSESESESEPELAFAKPGDDCEDFICGHTNSPEIDNLGLHELNLSYPNYEPEPRHHFRIASFTKNHEEYMPLLVQGVLTGSKVTAHNQVIAGPTLVGAEFLVVSDLTNTKYQLRIDGTGTVDYWAQTGGYQTPYYKITWKTVDASEVEWKNVCHSPPREGGLETLGMDTMSVVLFEGDRIDVKSKSVTGVDKSWMNIGCAGHAVSKLHMMGHSEAAQLATGMATSLDERTAVLKMLVADYCGTGNAFTVAGQPLSWIDDRNWLSLWPAWTYKLESRWTNKGATCMNTPRVLQNPSYESLGQFPDLLDSIKHACDGAFPPPCSGTLGDFEGAHMISANPLL